jgi:flagellin-like hook-associated protein FlgL
MNRISQQTFYSKINYELARMATEMSKLNESISSGKRVNRLSDDVLGGATILRMRTSLAEIDQYRRNLNVVKDWLTLSDSALMNIKNVVTDARVQAQQMSTDTYRPSNFDVAALNMSNLIDEVIQLANTDSAGRYLFGGTRTDSPPFTRALNILAPTPELTDDSLYTGRATSSGVYTGTQSKTYLVRVTAAGGAESTYASLTTNLDRADDDLAFTALAEGADGEAVTVEYVDPGAANQPLSVSVAGLAITVNLATDAAGAVTSTAAEVMAAIYADASASALVQVAHAPGSNGAGVVSALGPQNLGRGAANAAFTSNVASLTTDLAGADNDLNFSARAAGTEEEAIHIRYLDPGAVGQALSVSVSGREITVHLATDATGAVTSTAAQVMAAVNADVAASALVQASLAGWDDGSGRVSAMDYTPLIESQHTALTFNALKAGSDGNQIAVNYLNPGAADQETSVAVVNAGGGNYEIRITLGTDAQGAVTATAADVLAAIQAHEADPLDPLSVAATDLVEVALAGGSSGAGAIAALGTWNLAGGSDTTARFQVSEDGGRTWGPADDFAASTTGTAVFDSTGQDLDQGLRVAFTNEGTLCVGDSFEVKVSHYLGNDQALEVNIQRSHRLRLNVTGEEILGPDGDPDNVLDCLFRLYDALEAKDSAAVGAEIPALNRALENLTAQMAQNGVRINRTEVADNIMESNKLSSTQLLSDVEDVDIAEAITKLQLQQVAYQAALAATSMISKLSLLDYLS